MHIDNNKISIEIDDVEIFSNDIEGRLVATENGITVALDTTIDEELRIEGVAREFISTVQNMRKNSGFEVTDRIIITINCDDSIKTAITKMQHHIKNETLAEIIKFEKIDAAPFDFLDTTMSVAIDKKA